MATSLVRLRNVLNDGIPLLDIYEKLTKQMHFYILLLPRNVYKTSYTTFVSTSPLSVHMVFCTKTFL